MSVRYGSVRTECPCCSQPPVAFDSPEGRERRRQCVGHYRKVATVQFCLALLAIPSGATTFGLALQNAMYPYVAPFPLINGVLMLVAGFFGMKVGRANLDNAIPAAAKRNFLVHYVLSVVGCTFCSLAMVFSAICAGFCFTPWDSQNRAGCSPSRDVRIPLMFVDMVLGMLLLAICIGGCVLFCKHARTMGFVVNRMQSMQSEIDTLRAQVAVLGQQQQGGQGQGQGQGQQGLYFSSTAPPAYSSSGLPPPAYSDVAGSGVGGGNQWEQKYGMR